MVSGVYQIRNLINGKRYIGSAGRRGVERRLREHRLLLERGKHHSARLQRAWDKNGADAFVFEILEECKPSQCLEREQYYLDTILFASDDDGRFHNLGYNMSRAAQAIMTGRKHTKITKQKIAQSRLGQCSGEQHPFFGKTHSRSAIEKNREAHTKLTPTQILEIKELLAASRQTQTEIASQFDVHQSTISLIKNGKIWPDVGAPTGFYLFAVAE